MEPILAAAFGSWLRLPFLVSLVFFFVSGCCLHEGFAGVFSYSIFVDTWGWHMCIGFAWRSSMGTSVLFYTGSVASLVRYGVLHDLQYWTYHPDIISYCLALYFVESIRFFILFLLNPLAALYHPFHASLVNRFLSLMLSPCCYVSIHLVVWSGASQRHLYFQESDRHAFCNLHNLFHSWELMKVKGEMIVDCHYHFFDDLIGEKVTT